MTHVWVLIYYNHMEPPNIKVYDNHEAAIKNYRYYRHRYSRISLETHEIVRDCYLPDDWRGDDGIS